MSRGQQLATEQVEEIKAVAQALLDDKRSIALAKVVDYDPEGHYVRVNILPQLGPEPETTGWIQLNTSWGGIEWGQQGCLVEKEATVLVFFIEYPRGAIFAVGPFFNNYQKAPGQKEGLKKGEYLLKHKSGSKIKLNEDSTINIHHPTGTKVDINADSSVEVNHASGSLIKIDPVGNIEISAALLINVLSALINAGLAGGVFQGVVLENFMAIYNTHKHSGGGNPPTTTGLMTPLNISKNIKVT